MTIPTLMAKYQQRSFVVAWRKAFSSLSQAVKLMQENEEIMNSGDYSSQADYEFALANKLSQYIKTGAICKTGRFVADRCSPERYPIYKLNGDLWSSDISNFSGGAACMTTLNGEIMCFDYFIVIVDVNGYSKPNTVGRDIYFALIDFDNYIVRPAKGHRTGWGVADDVLIKVTEGRSSGKCDKTIDDIGEGCSFYYLHNMP